VHASIGTGSTLHGQGDSSSWLISLSYAVENDLLILPARC